MAWPGQIINRTTDSNVYRYRLVALGSARGRVTQATPGTQLCGVCDQPGPKSDQPTAADRRVDVIETGIADVEFGAAAAAGDWLAADDDGKAIPATSGMVFGFATAAFVEGEIGEIRIAPCVLPEPSATEP